MRTRNALFNTITSLLVQVVTLICGLILPRVILGAFGSDANGVVSSCIKFLSYISLIEAGIGGVTRAALYGPLANKNNSEISSIIKATENFFRRIALIFVVYTAVLAFLFPHIIQSEQTDMFVSLMVVVVSISTFIQYYFGISYSILLQADQCMYISNTLQIITIILNTVLSLVLINIGANLHIVKLSTSLVYIIRPVVLNVYARRKYHINKKSDPDNIAIKDKWNGLGHHIAYFIHSNTDIALITIFLNITEVSVYSVYAMVTTGLQSIVLAISNSFEAGFGNMIAKKENTLLDRTFRDFELLVSAIALTSFISAARVVVPFVAIYTKGIADANYIRPFTAFLMLAAEMVYCIRTPYVIVTLASGHYKQTRRHAYIEAAINVLLSIVLIKPFGISGIVFATLLAMLVRMVLYSYYASKNILHRRYLDFVKRTAVNAVNIVLCVIVDWIVPIAIDTYTEFFLCGAVFVLINATVTLIINLLLYPKQVRNLWQRFKGIISRKTVKA